MFLSLALTGVHFPHTVTPITNRLPLRLLRRQYSELRFIAVRACRNQKTSELKLPGLCRTRTP